MFYITYGVLHQTGDDVRQAWSAYLISGKIIEKLKESNKIEKTPNQLKIITITQNNAPLPIPITKNIFSMFFCTTQYLTRLNTPKHECYKLETT